MYLTICSYVWAWGGVVVKALRYKSKVPGSIPGGVTGDFFSGIRQFHVPGVDSASLNEYHDTTGGKDGWCVWLTTYHLQVPMLRNLEAFTSPEPSGPHRPVMGLLYLLYYNPQIQTLHRVKHVHLPSVILHRITEGSSDKS
jgi:hypothetical protein